jgi:hypothetical protein
LSDLAERVLINPVDREYCVDTLAELRVVYVSVGDVIYLVIIDEDFDLLLA